eukprot:621431-Prymnesium_polylepis.1
MLLGKSLGSCPTAYLAAITLFRGVVLVGGIASGARVLWPSSRNPLSDSIAFNNLSKLKKCESLVQIIHGKQDRWPHAALAGCKLLLLALLGCVLLLLLAAAVVMVLLSRGCSRQKAAAVAR